VVEQRPGEGADAGDGSVEHDFLGSAITRSVGVASPRLSLSIRKSRGHRVGVGPVDEPEQGLDERLPEWSQGVLDRHGSARHNRSLHTVRQLQVAERLRQHLLGDSIHATFQVAVSMRAVAQHEHDERGPLVRDENQRLTRRALGQHLFGSEKQFGIDHATLH
jgi:hypothetical protein